MHNWDKQERITLGHLGYISGPLSHCVCPKAKRPGITRTKLTDSHECSSESRRFRWLQFVVVVVVLVWFVVVVVVVVLVWFVVVVVVVVLVWFVVVVVVVVLVWFVVVVVVVVLVWFVVVVVVVVLVWFVVVVVLLWIFLLNAIIKSHDLSVR